jgi:hypothetical protein
MIWPAPNVVTEKCQSQQENEIGYRGTEANNGLANIEGKTKGKMRIAG